MPRFAIDSTVGRFQSDLAEAVRRHPSVVEDLREALEKLEDNPGAGVWVPGVGAEVRKLRVGVKKQNIGKSAGYRLLYLVEPDAKTIRLLFFHFKPRKAIVPPVEIGTLLKTLGSSSA